MPDLFALPLPPAGEELLRRLLELLARQVDGAVGAVLAVAQDAPDGHAPLVLAATALAGGDRLGGLSLTSSVTAALAAALRDDAPVLTPDPAGGVGVVAVRGPAPGAGDPDVVVAVLLERPPAPPDADLVRRALPAAASAVAVLGHWAAEGERAEQMVRMVEYRRVIEQAKGLVMAATGADAAAAFATLARASQHFNVRLRSLAVALVELVGGAPAEGPADPAAVVVPGERERVAAARTWAALGGGPLEGPSPDERGGS